MQEYQRCAHILKRNNCTDKKSKFLELYSLYLAGERRKRCDAAADAAAHTAMSSLLCTPDAECAAVHAVV